MIPSYEYSGTSDGLFPPSLIILLTGLVLPTTLYFLYHFLASSRSQHTLATRENCQRAPHLPQKKLFLGLDTLLETVHAIKSKTYLQKILRSYREQGYTYSKSFLFSSSICTVAPENLKAILSTNFKDYGITSARKDAFRPLIGQNILLAEGTEWTHARAMLRPSFSKKQFSDLNMFEEHVHVLIHAIRRQQGCIVPLKDLFLNLTADVTTHSMFGESINSLSSPHLNSIMQAFQDAQYGCENRGRLGKFAMFTPQRKFYRSRRIVRQYLEEHVEKGLKSLQTQTERDRDPDTLAKKESRYVLLDELVKTPASKTRLRDELLTIFFAGRDTTASLLSSLFFNLAKRPSIWHRLRIDVAPLHDETPALAQLQKLSYCTYCLNETLRLHPPLPHNARVALVDTILPVGGGPSGRSPVLVPRGTAVEFHASALHRRSDLWGEDASEFRPERWEKQTANDTAWRFLPFSAGPRQCIGQGLGWTLALYTLVRLVQTFESLESEDMTGEWTENLGVVCFPEGRVGVRMTAAG